MELMNRVTLTFWARDSLVKIVQMITREPRPHRQQPPKTLKVPLAVGITVKNAPKICLMENANPKKVQ